MPQTKQKNFHLPLDLCKALEDDPRSQRVIVEAALRQYLLTVQEEDQTPVEAPSRPEVNYSDRVAQLSRTLPPATAARIAGLEAGR